MKKLMLTIALVALIATPALANLTGPSLGYWQEGDAGTTHQYWYLTPASKNNDQFTPEEIINPNNGYQVFLQQGMGTYDASGTGSINSNPLGLITIDLKINNYLNLTNYKYVWVDLGLTNGSVIGASLTATDHVPMSVTLLGPSGDADFGWYVIPNPYFEDILITIQADAAGVPAVLDYVHVDTICIPAPGAILLGGIGVSLVGWLRRRRTL